MLKHALLAGFTLLSVAATVTAHEAKEGHNDHHNTLPRCIAFPNTAEGKSVLAVDLHTHSVFSDGNVWPTIRVDESRRDCLTAMAVTEHLEWQPHKDDIPHPDRNRSFEVAQQHVERRDVPLLLIPGAEITRFFPPGHVNAIFIEDANKLLFPRGNRQKPLIKESKQAIDAAAKQNAFMFWNHPYWTRDFANGIVELSDMHRELIAQNKLHGIEVANGDHFSEEALQIALDNNLAILGTSDIHGLIDWDYDIANGGHRTATLVVSEEPTLAGIEKAIRANKTVAIFKKTLIGRDAELQQVLSGMLTLEVGEYRRRSTVLNISIHNHGPIDLMLRNVGDKRFADAGDIVAVPAHGSAKVQVKDVPNTDDFALAVEVLSAFNAPQQHPTLTLKAQ